MYKKDIQNDNDGGFITQKSKKYKKNRQDNSYSHVRSRNQFADQDRNGSYNWRNKNNNRDNNQYNYIPNKSDPTLGPFLDFKRDLKEGNLLDVNILVENMRISEDARKFQYIKELIKATQDDPQKFEIIEKLFDPSCFPKPEKKKFDEITQKYHLPLHDKKSNTGQYIYLHILCWLGPNYDRQMFNKLAKIFYDSGDDNFINNAEGENVFESLINYYNNVRSISDEEFISRYTAIAYMPKDTIKKVTRNIMNKNNFNKIILERKQNNIDKSDIITSNKSLDRLTYLMRLDWKTVLEILAEKVLTIKCKSSLIEINQEFITACTQFDILFDRMDKQFILTDKSLEIFFKYDKGHIQFKKDNVKEFPNIPSNVILKYHLLNACEEFIKTSSNKLIEYNVQNFGSFVATYLKTSKTSKTSKTFKDLDSYYNFVITYDKIDLETKIKTVIKMICHSELSTDIAYQFLEEYQNKISNVISNSSYDSYDEGISTALYLKNIINNFIKPTNSQNAQYKSNSTVSLTDQLDTSMNNEDDTIINFKFFQSVPKKIDQDYFDDEVYVLKKRFENIKDKDKLLTHFICSFLESNLNMCHDLDNISELLRSSMNEEKIYINYRIIDNIRMEHIDEMKLDYPKSVHLFESLEKTCVSSHHKDSKKRYKSVTSTAQVGQFNKYQLLDNK